MPLAPQSAINRWYKTDSFIYRQFAFCYQNPLWNRPIPKGYSLCPLFWQSIVVGMIMMPLFVYSILPFKILFGKLKPKNPEVVVAMTPVFGTLAALTALLIYWAVLLYEVHELASFFLLFPLAILFMVCLIYADCMKDEPNRCQVEWYVRGACAICLVLGQWLMPASTLSVFSDIWGAICSGATWIVALFAACKTVGLWALGAFAIMTLVGWIVSKAMASDASPAKEYAMSLDKIAHELYIYGHGETEEFPRFWLKWLNKHDPIGWLERFNQLDADVRALCNEILTVFLAERETERQNKALRASKCKVWTDALARLFSPVVLNVGTFIAYMGELIKARKQGVCPYLMFEDPVSAQKDDEKV